MMMKRGKYESNVMNTMFPRLHVNDTEKGGPKAPPRNKMALYEHLIIPSERFNSGSQSMLPLPPNNSNILVPSMPSSYNGGKELNMLLPLANSHESSVLPDEKFCSCSTPGTELNNMKGSPDKISAKTTEYCSLEPLEPLHFSNFKKFSLRSLGHDDLMVPTSFLSGIDRNRGCSKQSEGGESFSKLNLYSSKQLQTSNEKQMKENGRLCESSEDLTERPNSIVSTIDENLAGMSTDPSINIKNSGTLKAPYSLLNQENESITVDMLNGDVPNARLHLKDNILMESDRCLENASMVKIVICSRQSHGLDNGSTMHEKKTSGIQLEGINRHKNVPGASVADYTSAFDICPDDVVGIIGENHFWRVRRAIANQQRVFSGQVFELHRLIMVQRLIASSPHMLFGDTFYMDKPSLDVPQPPLIVKVKSNSRKPDISMKYAGENAFAELPCSSANDDTGKGLNIKRPKYGPYSGNASSTPMASNSGPPPWCVSPLGSQWLVPIMSPLEGLVYKPFTGPSPPAAGLFTPVYGSSGPLNLAVGSLDFPNMANSVAASQQHEIGILRTDPPICRSDLPHHGQLEHMSQVTKVQSKANFTIAQHSSCNMLSQLSEVISYRAKKPPASNETSSRCERVKVDALPLFPTEPVMPSSNHDAQTHEQRTQVIKVIPHSHASATESAARIFRCIQEERKQHD